MVDGLLVALAVLNAYIILLFVLHQRGKLRGPRLELMGPFLMWRTEQGKQLIDRISRPRRFWRGSICAQCSHITRKRDVYA